MNFPWRCVDPSIEAANVPTNLRSAACTYYIQAYHPIPTHTSVLQALMTGLLPPGEHLLLLSA